MIFNEKAAVFDLDGTLVDSMGMWEKIDIIFFAKRGMPLDPDYLDTVKIMDLSDAAHYTKERYRLPETEKEIAEEWYGMVREEYANNILLKPCAKELLAKLKSEGILLALATASLPEMYLPALRNNGILEFFDVLCCTDEVGRSKEHPDIFLLAADRLGVPPDDCIAFEDSLGAIKSAKAAGMKVVGVYDRYSAEEKEEIVKIADAYVNGFCELC